MEIELAGQRQHDSTPNLKLVMNPEGKCHDWTDLPEHEVPEMEVMAAGGVSPDTAHHVVQNLQECKGRGEWTWSMGSGLEVFNVFFLRW